MVPAAGVEPALSTYEADVLPLNYAGMNIGAVPRSCTGICRLQGGGPPLERERRGANGGNRTRSPCLPNRRSAINLRWQDWWARRESHSDFFHVTEAVCC